MREAYDQALAGWSEAMERFVASDEFASASGDFLKRYVEMHESLRGASKAAAESIHLPTTDDIARLAQLVVNVERKVDEVSDEAHAIAQRLAAIEAAVEKLARDVPAKAPKATRGAPRRRAATDSEG